VCEYNVPLPGKALACTQLISDLHAALLWGLLALLKPIVLSPRREGFIRTVVLMILVIVVVLVVRMPMEWPALPSLPTLPAYVELPTTTI